MPTCGAGFGRTPKPSLFHSIALVAYSTVMVRRFVFAFNPRFHVAAYPPVRDRDGKVANYFQKTARGRVGPLFCGELN